MSRAIFLLFVPIIALIVILLLHTSYFTTDSHYENIKRQLASRRKNNRNRKRGFDNSKDYYSKVKSKKLSSVVKDLIVENPPKDFYRASWSNPHRRDSQHVIFVAAMYPEIFPYEIKYFAGTARKIGFDGDIVAAIEPGLAPNVITKFKIYDSIVYNVSLACEGVDHDKLCSFYNSQRKFSINMIRYHLYRWWSMEYTRDTIIMISDFRDVFFQSNPFLYKPEQWAPPASKLVVFQEAHPNAVIKRCPFNKGWIRSCYGTEALEKIGHNTVSCSGVSMGTRDAILVYSHLMIQQTDPQVRLGSNASEEDNHKCVSIGMDQGFHNWMLYSGMLDKYMDVRIFQQGEGPVNTMGGFFGKKKLLQFSLEKWGLLQGKVPHAYIANWNGDRSPVVHQLDRYLAEEYFGGEYENKLDVMNELD